MSLEDLISLKRKAARPQDLADIENLKLLREKIMTNKSTKDDNRTWDSGWQGHTSAQLSRLAILPFSEKLKWLEDAHHLVLKFDNARKKRFRRHLDNRVGSGL